MSPSVTVLMPVFNESSVVCRAVESILSQSFQDWELLIVDDGSSDDTLRKLQSYGNARITVLAQPHRGIAASLNHGLRQARGRYIARMDADDQCHSDRLLQQFQFLEANPQTGAVACKVRYQTAEPLPDGYRRYVDWTNEIITPAQIAASRFVESPVAHPSIMFRKQLIASYGGYTEEKVPEDYELWLRWMNEGITIAKLDQVLLTWFDRGNRLSRIDDHYKESAFYQVKARYLSHWYIRYGGKRPLYIWGHGKVMRRRLKYFEDAGLKIAGFIDLKERKDERFIYYKSVEIYHDGIVLGFVADARGKQAIRSFLMQHLMEEGVDFFMMV
ncbi:MAG: glycosyltransferase [Bacteroidota bacterium]